MSKYFNIRHPLTVTIGDQSHEYFIRELGYLHLQELIRTVKSDRSDTERSGLALMQAIVLASVEESDGSLSYQAEDWRNELERAVLEIGKAAMKVNGLDIDKAKENAEVTEAEVEGNEQPSRKSGVNSPSTSAARSENSKAA
jgi:hypothetical protein